MMPWTLNFLRRMARHMTIPSALRMRSLVLREDGRQLPRAGLVRIRVKHPFRGDVWLREPGSDVSTFQEIAIHQIYRRAVELSPGARYVFDIGGNIGLTTRYFASQLPECQVLTVEPSGENYQLLCRNVADLVAVGRCQPVQAAVWGEDSTIQVGAPPGGNAYHAVQVHAAGGGATDGNVAGYTVGSLLRLSGFPRIDILKMDIEGSETAVFRGDTEWLSAVGLITIEFHGNSRAESRFDEVVRGHGFEVRDDDFPCTALAIRTSPPAATRES